MMASSQRKGIITLLHKGENLERDNLSNWRPITLLKDSLLDDSLHETFEIRKKKKLINLIDFNPTHSDNRSPGFPH